MARYVFGLDGTPTVCETDTGRLYYCHEQTRIEQRAWRLAHECVQKVCKPGASVQSVIEAFEMGYILMIALDPATIIADIDKGG